jgi:hypothetical protein
MCFFLHMGAGGCGPKILVSTFYWDVVRSFPPKMSYLNRSQENSMIRFQRLNAVVSFLGGFARLRTSGNRQVHGHGALALLFSAVLLVALVTVGSTLAVAQFAGPTPLTLTNGWTNYSFGTSVATVEEVTGIVQLRGAIATSGTNPVAFTLPAGLSPATDVYVPVDLCNATKGRIHIVPSGAVDVEAQTFSNAQCFTSLDGASFAPSTAGFTALTLVNGWVNAPFSTSNAEAQKINGFVHFKGAISSGTTGVFTTLPAPFRPTTDVYVPVDLCGATNGRIHIVPSGVVDVEAEGGTFSNAQCFTSLDGAWFAVAPSAFETLTLINGWTNGPFGTFIARAGGNYGIVFFRGAIASGTTAQPFVLPLTLRPVTTVYIHLDMCNATNGRLIIQPNGVATVQAETAFSNAQCFTSLDGVSFVQ